ncbi:ABC transporter ATP-binding protein [Amedibacillus sp. YH-ame10]
MEKIKFIWRYAKPHRKQFSLIFLDVLMYALFMLLGPLIISYIVDNVIAGVPFENAILNDIANQLGGISWLQDNLWVGSLLIVIVYLCTAFAIHKRSVHTGNVSETFARNVRDEMYDHLQKLPFSYHKMKDSGDLIQRSTSDIETIRRFIASQLSEMMFAIINASLAAAILFSRNVKLTLISISLIPILLLVSFIFFKKAKKIFLECDLAESKMTTVLQEDLNAMRVVKAFHQEKVEIEKFEESNEEYRGKLYELMHALALFWSCSDLIGQLQILLMVVFGIIMAMNNELTLGTFLIFLMYESTIVWPMRQLGRILADMGKVSVSITRIEEVLHEEMEDLEGGVRPNIKGNIVFQNVCFHYEDDEQHTLKDVSFEVPAHSKVAIMGPTGSGKSSLVHLLSGIYDYDQGSITIDGVELKEIAKSWLREHVQIVLQEPFLFSKTIYENIELANRDAKREDVMSIARLASIHKDIEAFDSGYDTMVGEKGVTLSGGQKQRVAIARTLLSKSPIIIFDDSLSALDTKTDAMIQDALNSLEDPMTMFMITHRVNSAQSADLILVLDQGKLVQKGSHEELLKEDGIYRRIYELQNAGGDDYE